MAPAFKNVSPPGTRATVTSIRGFLGGIVNAGAFAVFALLANGDDPRPGLYLALGALVVLGVAAPYLLGRAREPATVC